MESTPHKSNFKKTFQNNLESPLQNNLEKTNQSMTQNPLKKTAQNPLENSTTQYFSQSEFTLDEKTTSACEDDSVKFFKSIHPSIVFEDEHLLVLYKPASYYVHPPENKYAKQKVGRNTCIHWLQDYHRLRAFPIHRLDYATEGLVLFGKTTEATSKLNEMMRSKEIKKYYDAIVRGWFKEPYGTINLQLELDSTGELVDCTTLYSTLHKLEVNASVNSKFNTARYSWLDIELKTGRWHQIRRHMNRVAHPVIGDREHGDSHHNRFFRDSMKVDGLCLKAKRLVFTHPVENKIIDITSPMSDKWLKLTELFTTSDKLST